MGNQNSSLEFNTILSGLNLNDDLHAMFASISDLQFFNYSQFDLTSQNLIGEGGSGSVYKFKLENSQVAIQRIHLREDSSNQVLISILNEIITMKKKVSTHIAEILGFSMEPDPKIPSQIQFFYIVMKLYEDSLFTWKIKHSPSKEFMNEQLKITHEITKALLILHSEPHSTAHADLSPDNVLIDQQNSAFVTDFGISVILDGRTRATGSKTGQLNFAPPEQIQQNQTSLKTDIFSLGKIIDFLFEFSDQDAQNPLYQLAQNMKAENYKDRPDVIKVLDELQDIMIRKEKKFYEIHHNNKFYWGTLSVEKEGVEVNLMRWKFQVLTEDKQIQAHGLIEINDDYPQICPDVVPFFPQVFQNWNSNKSLETICQEIQAEIQVVHDQRLQKEYQERLIPFKCEFTTPDEKFIEALINIIRHTQTFSDLLTICEENYIFSSNIYKKIKDLYVNQGFQPKHSRAKMNLRRIFYQKDFGNIVQEFLSKKNSSTELLQVVIQSLLEDTKQKQHAKCVYESITIIKNDCQNCNKTESNKKNSNYFQVQTPVNDLPILIEEMIIDQLAQSIQESVCHSCGESSSLIQQIESLASLVIFKFKNFENDLTTSQINLKKQSIIIPEKISSSELMSGYVLNLRGVIFQDQSFYVKTNDENWWYFSDIGTGLELKLKSGYRLNYLEIQQNILLLIYEQK